MQKEKDLFSPFYISMVKAGEESGKLNDSFLFLADHLDREYELNQKTKKALTYPAFVIGTFVVIMVAMFVFVIPKMASLFADQGSELPTVTRIILGMSNFFVNNGLYILVVLIIAYFLFKRYAKTEEGTLAIDTLKTKVPVFKNLFQKIFLARFADNMNTMLTSGVTIVRSIEITSDVVDNELYRRLLLRTIDKVKNGVALSKALSDEPQIPNILVQMVHIGEETGELGYILKNLSNFYKREVDNAVDAVVGLIEPAMIVGLGLGVGVLVSAVLLPMYSLSSAVG
jgi:type IV pilus assembly protein PilC